MAPGSSALPGWVGPATGIPATASGARASRLQSRRFHRLRPLGATGYARVPGAEAHARQFYTLDDALALRRELQALRLKRRGGLLRVAVVGNGYIGTELSANLARLGSG